MFYADWDEDSGSWCVFSSEKDNGHAYSSWATKEQAEADAAERSKKSDDLIDEILAEIHDDERTWSETVQVGDWVDASDDGHYTFSNHQYKTKGRLYQVRVVDLRPDSKTVIVDGDYKDPRRNGEPERVWLGQSRVIIRNGEIVWESSLQKAINLYDLTEESKTLDDEERRRWEEMKYIPNLSDVII